MSEHLPGHSVDSCKLSMTMRLFGFTSLGFGSTALISYWIPTLNFLVFLLSMVGLSFGLVSLFLAAYHREKSVSKAAGVGCVLSLIVSIAISWELLTGPQAFYLHAPELATTRMIEEDAAELLFNEVRKGEEDLKLELWHHGERQGPSWYIRNLEKILELYPDTEIAKKVPERIDEIKTWDAQFYMECADSSIEKKNLENALSWLNTVIEFYPKIDLAKEAQQKIDAIEKLMKK